MQFVDSTCFVVRQNRVAHVSPMPAAPAAAAISALLCATPLSALPTKLVILSHGLYGGASNLQVLQDQLVRIGGSDVLVHQASDNEGNTRDGVAAGGKRLAEEVRGLARRNPSLESLVLVGNSLGGLYVRYAAAELMQDDRGAQRMAGLVPDTLVTIGCPHLGVRRHTFLPLPPQLLGLDRVVAGRTAEDLLLRDAETASASLVAEMASCDSRFGAALAAFARRRLYANLQGDFMVPFGTASIEPGWGAGVADSWRMRNILERVGPTSLVQSDERVLAGEADGIGVVWARGESDDGTRPEMAQPRGVDGDEIEVEMCRQLNQLEWSKVGVSFSGISSLLPLGHNKLAALKRTGWRKVFEKIEGAPDGEPIMRHAAEFILSSDR